ncbi:MAG: RDD family protein [Cytophagales bacterium]
MEQYAAFWKRLIAVVIDGIIIGIVQTFVFVPILGALGFGFFSNMEEMQSGDPDAALGLVGAIVAALGAVWVLAMVIQVLYFSFMESSKTQATLGKMVLGIIVTDTNGAPLNFSKALVRNLCRLLSNCTMLIGYVIAAFTAKKQALHDIIAGTLVVNKA